MDSFAPALAFALLHSLWQGALLAAAAALTLRAMPRATAAARHSVAMGFLVAMVLAPAAQLAIYANSDAPLQPGPLLAVLDARLGAFAAPLMVAAWVAGVAFMVARHWVGFRTIVAMERERYLDLPKEWLDRAERVRRALGAANTVAVRLSEAVVTPCVTHISRPIIWLPATFIARMPAKQLEALIAHELAHVVRRDRLWNGLQNAIEAVLFYHPAVWWLGKRIRQEREHACDDLAVAACGDAIALAEVLADLERARHATSRVRLAANGGALLQRVTRLLGETPLRARRGVLAMLGATAIVCALLMGQVGVGGGQPHDLHVESSTSGPLGPGDYREIRAIEDGIERYYRASVDRQGRLTEEYQENGRARLIDADVRAWLEGLSP
jgi:beta-lactamase regulating signal transducer with metallopeptidase domain